MIMIVPSRGRPQNIRELCAAWTETQSTAGLVVAIDEDDEYLDEYLSDASQQSIYKIIVGERKRLGGTLNSIASDLVHDSDVIGFLGDDHRPRTPQWDQKIEETLREMGTGIVYGNDLIQAENLPTAVFMTSDIIRTLGYMCAPGLIHLYIDNFWKELGLAAGCLRYLPDVVIEHVHPIAGKTEWDETYKEANDGGVEMHDKAMFDEWFANQRLIDAEKIRALGGVV